MPAAKCSGCAKFLSTLDAAKCAKCNALYHRVCVNLPMKGNIKPTWCCPDCSKNVLRDNRAETPVRSNAAFVQVQDHCSDELKESSPLSFTASDAPVDLPSDVADELRLFKEELRSEFRLVHSELQEIRTEMVELKASLKTSDERINSLDARVGDLEIKLEQKLSSEKDSSEDPLPNIIAELKCQLNERDQELLLNDVEVTGIPEHKNESILHLVQVLTTKLGVTIDERDVVHAERVGSTRRNRVEASEGAASADPADERPRGISVRFARRATRDALLRAARVRRGLSTDDLELAGSTRRVFVNERLTRTNRNLFYRARQAGSLHKWKYVWTGEGKILARREDGLKVARIRCEEDICKTFG